MSHSILDIPQELLQKIVILACGTSVLGPPKELSNCLLTCSTFAHYLSPSNASDLYFSIFCQKFDAAGPVYRLGSPVIRKNARMEMRRRFSAIQIFKDRALDHPGLTEAFWIAYLMVEDSDTSQKNVKQLLRARLPSFLDVYLRRRLYEGSDKNNGWPILTEKISLAIALAWTLASQRVMSNEDTSNCKEMMRLLRPIVFASFRYSIFQMAEDNFPESISPSRSTELLMVSYPASVLPPKEIIYFGSVKRKARAPSGSLFAVLLYFTRTESSTPFRIPSHIICATREEAIQKGIAGPCIEDIRHFYEHCRTRFADFPGIDVGIHSSAVDPSADTILCQPSAYKLGTLCGQWQGSWMIPSAASYEDWATNDVLPEDFDIEYRKPLYLTLEEHYCCNLKSVVPRDDEANGVKNAWLPSDLKVIESPGGGIEFTDSKGTFHTSYQTFQVGQTPIRGQKEIVDVIITGKTDDQYLSAWGGGSKIIGRIRMNDGLMVLSRFDPNTTAFSQILRGYVTSSQNLVGRLNGPLSGSESHYGAFSLSKNHTGMARMYHSLTAT